MNGIKTLFVVFLFFGILSIALQVLQSKYSLLDEKIIIKYIPIEREEGALSRDIKTLFDEPSPWLERAKRYENESEEKKIKQYLLQKNN